MSQIKAPSLFSHSYHRVVMWGLKKVTANSSTDMSINIIEKKYVSKWNQCISCLFLYTFSSLPFAISMVIISLKLQLRNIWKQGDQLAGKAGNMCYFQK